MSAFVTLVVSAIAALTAASFSHDLTLAFGRERTGLVGRNGVGKTTLARLILGERAHSRRDRASPAASACCARRLQPPPGAARRRPDAAWPSRWSGWRGSSAGGERGRSGDADWALPARLEAALAEVGLAGVAMDRPGRRPERRPGHARGAGGAAGRRARRAAAGRADQQPRRRGAAPRSPRVLRGWKGGAVVVSHDRALLREMDRIVELSGLGAGLRRRLRPLRRAAGGGAGGGGARAGRRRTRRRPGRARGPGGARAQGPPRRRRPPCGQGRRAEDRAGRPSRARRRPPAADAPGRTPAGRGGRGAGAAPGQRRAGEDPGHRAAAERPGGRQAGAGVRGGRFRLAGWNAGAGGGELRHGRAAAAGHRRAERVGQDHPAAAGGRGPGADGGQRPAAPASRCSTSARRSWRHAGPSWTPTAG